MREVSGEQTRHHTNLLDIFHHPVGWAELSEAKNSIEYIDDKKRPPLFSL